ncbi:MAG: addiction module protein [Gammaproteobacteria bacterium]|nr:addiction module protein [Gammaproteobacteria bacterium]
MSTSLRELPLEERIRLHSRIWDSIAEEEAALPVPDSHKRELDARLRAFELDGDYGDGAEAVIAEDSKVAVTRRVLLRKEAQDDLNEAAIWYEDSACELARVLDEARSALSRIASAPLAQCRCVSRPTARPSAAFPFVIYYRVEPKVLSVVAIMHGSRSPDAWKVRTSQAARSDGATRHRTALWLHVTTTARSTRTWRLRRKRGARCPLAHERWRGCPRRSHP